MALPAVDRLVLRFAPSVVTAPMMTTAMRATIRPYSMAVAPDSLAAKREKKARMVRFLRLVRFAAAPRSVSAGDINSHA